MFKKYFVVLLSVFLFSCTHTDDEEANSQFFNAPRGKVWEALVAVFKDYPLKTIDEQRGYIETEVLQADRFWKAPHQKNLDFAGYSSVILVSLEYKKPIARVFINKKIYRQKGFIAKKQEVPSDLLEENLLLYRVARELTVRSQLKKFQ